MPSELPPLEEPEHRPDYRRSCRQSEARLWLPETTESLGLLAVDLGQQPSYTHCEPALDVIEINVFSSSAPIRSLLEYMGIRVRSDLSGAPERRRILVTFPHPGSVNDRIRVIYPGGEPPKFVEYPGAKYSSAEYVAHASQREVLLASEDFSASHDPIIHLPAWLMFSPDSLDRLQKYTLELRGWQEEEISFMHTADSRLGLGGIATAVQVALRQEASESKSLTAHFEQLLNVSPEQATSLARNSLKHFRRLLENAKEHNAAARL